MCYSQKKINNKGFTLIELIVVLAIMVVMVGAATVTVTMLNSSYAEDAERGIKDYISLGRTKSMSIAAKEWYVSITKIDDNYYACLYKVTQEVDADGNTNTNTSLIEKNELGNKISIYFAVGKDDSGNIVDKKLIDDTNELRFYFDPSTGKINNVKYGMNNQSVTSGIGYVCIARNDYVINLKVFYNTCKCERE